KFFVRSGPSHAGAPANLCGCIAHFILKHQVSDFRLGHSPTRHADRHAEREREDVLRVDLLAAKEFLPPERPFRKRSGGPLLTLRPNYRGLAIPVEQSGGLSAPPRAEDPGCKLESREMV